MLEILQHVLALCIYTLCSYTSVVGSSYLLRQGLRVLSSSR